MPLKNENVHHSGDNMECLIFSFFFIWFFLQKGYFGQSLGAWNSLLMLYVNVYAIVDQRGRR